MNDATKPREVSRLSLFRNWLSFAGLVVILSSLFAFLLLFVFEVIARVSNPYVGILTFFVAPAFTVLGFVLLVAGALLRKWRVVRSKDLVVPTLTIDLGRPRDRKILLCFLGGSFLFLLITAMGTYHTYHFTESVQFCGQACHQVMEPEMVTYAHGPHARVSCTACHIGPGATWFVRSKLSGAYQVYATLADKYPRPIPTPVRNLRPAQETCEQCHWPEKFVGNLDRTYAHYLSDETNTFHAVRMLLLVGGADPTHGPVGGIHWHMNVANKVEYIATDESRQTIPWVRLTDPQGVVTEYSTPDVTNELNKAAIRTMDCMDCHNRPAHVFKSPNDAVDLALLLGRIDVNLPYIKANATEVLTQEYPNKTQALQGIATFLSQKYPGHPSLRTTIEAVQEVYQKNFFAEMRANWSVYPDNIGHKDWIGCFRCHQGNHKSADGNKAISSDCNSCHIILAQGSGPDLEQLTPKGQEFKHPGEEYDNAFLCNDCHTGGP
jgi:nitrate/TMAO reductase-like tetraheme cytochrome c subunit